MRRYDLVKSKTLQWRNNFFRGCREVRCNDTDNKRI